MTFVRTPASASDASTAFSEHTPKPGDPAIPLWAAYDEGDLPDEEDGLLSDGQRSDGEAYGEAGANRPWLVHYRVAEFAVSIAVLALSGALALTPVHIRSIPSVEASVSAGQTAYARDPTIDRKLMPETVTTMALVVGGTSVPVLVNLFINYALPKLRRVRVIPHDTRDFLLSLLQSIGISQVLTQFVKNFTGRLRPCFYDMCKWNYDVVWDGKTNLCQDAAWEKEARLSFPSGHASYAWSTLFLLSLYLLGRSRLNVDRRTYPRLGGGSRTLKLFVCFLPTLVAAWVAVTRTVDNWHHYGDILAGSTIGAFAAGVSYNYNYGSIFHWEWAGMPHSELHQRRPASRSPQTPVTDDTIIITIK